VPQNKQLDSLPVLPTTPLEKQKTAHSKISPPAPHRKCCILLYVKKGKFVAY